MPTINIPAKIRFALYMIAAVGMLVVTYAVDKSWAGDAEVRLATALAALINLLAAARTDFNEARGYELSGHVEQHSGHMEGTVLPPTGATADRERGASDLVTILAAVILMLLILVIFSELVFDGHR